MKMNRIIVLAFAMLLGMADAMAQEDFNKAQKAPQNKEVVLAKDIRTRSGHDNIQAAYRAALREAKQANPKKEVGIRNIKTKQKVSGCFRTNDGADIYMMVKSIMETANKNGQSKYGALQTLVNL